MKKKPHGSLYVAYLQESPETANPSISSLLPINCKTPKNLPAHPLTVNFNLHPPFFQIKVVIYFEKKTPINLHTKATLYPQFFLAVMTHAKLLTDWASIVAGQFSATRKRKVE